MDERLKFFTTNEGGKDFSRPWHDCGWDYATDGAICVRVPALSSLETEIGERKVPRAYGAFDPIPPDAKWRPWPKEVRLKLRRNPHTGFLCRSVFINPAWIACGYYEKIFSLDDAAYCDFVSHEGAIAFRASGGLEGRVMPVADA